MATPTNSNPANPVSAIPVAAAPAEAKPQRAQGISSEIAALSAGVCTVMGPEDTAGRPQDTAAGPENTAASNKINSDAEEENALVASSEAVNALVDQGLIERQGVEARLPVQLDVGIPIRDFRVRNLVMLEPGSLVESQWEPGEDVPVSSSDVQLAWSEFEVVDTQLAVRLTRLT